MASPGFISKELFMFSSRFLFRTCEITCNHAARILAGKRCLSKGRLAERLANLNQERMSLQETLNRIGQSHGHVCAECKGHCCGGVRERDAFIDRVLQDPATPHRNARRNQGLSPVFIDGFCPELTTSGCRIPYQLRPIQCTVYFCRRTLPALSNDELSEGRRAINSLMGVQIRTVLAILGARVAG